MRFHFLQIIFKHNVFKLFCTIMFVRDTTKIEPKIAQKLRKHGDLPKTDGTNLNTGHFNAI